MDAIKYKRAAGLYYSCDEAEKTVQALKEAGYDLGRICVIAKDTDQVAGHKTEPEIGNKADEGAAAGAFTGGALGGITGLLVGLGALVIPGIGPILLAGAEATAIATTLAGAGIGAAAGGLVGALIGLGIPEEKAQLYSARVSKGSFLIMVTGTAVEVNQAATIMRRHGVEEFDIYDATPPKPRATRTAVATQTTTNSGTTDFSDGEIARIKLCQESVDIDKQAFVREQVDIRKQLERDTVEAAKTIRREELEVQADGDVIKR